MPNYMERAVVTGIGIVTANSGNRKDFLTALIEGKSGIGISDMFKKIGVRTDIAGVINESYPEIKNVGDKEKILWMSKKVIDEAFEDCGLSKSNIEDMGPRAGMSFSTSLLGNEYMMKYIAESECKTEDAGIWLLNMQSSIRDIALYVGVKGSVFTTSSACASGTAGAGIALDQIRNGYTDMMLILGCDPLTEFSAAGFHSLKTMSKDGCKPFDKNRDGMIIGESAVAIIVESLSHAKKRNAHIYGEICGYGIGNDAYHITSPDPTGAGAYYTMKSAIENAGIQKEDIDYINVHGTATNINDKMEINAITKLFEADKRYSVMISSTKSMTGHCLGAAGSVELAVVLLSVANDFVPPTVNLFDIADEFKDFNIIQNRSINAKVKYAISNSFAFGGNSACVVVGKY